MILAINTAQREHELALLRENPSNAGEWELLAERIWPDEYDHKDVEQLVPKLQEILDEAGASKSDITAIVVVKGPGSFSSLRTGVAFANALASGLEARLFALTTFELLQRKAAVSDPVLAILHAGRLDCSVQFKDEPVRVGALAALLNDYPHDHGIQVVAELPEALEDELSPLIREKQWKRIVGHELQSMGEMLMTYGLASATPAEIVEPYYLRGPHITKSSDPWKQ